MKKTVLLLALPLTMIISCSKEKLDPVSSSGSSASASFIPLKVGNYWVYETYEIDTLGNEKLTTQYDSVTVIKDTLINGQTYFKVQSSGATAASLFRGSYLRNDSHTILSYNLVDQKDDTLFSLFNHGSIIKTRTFSSPPIELLMETWVHVTPKEITTNAGSFRCYNEETLFSPTQQNYPWYPRSNHRTYSNKVGIITDQYNFFSSPNLYEKRLVRFHLN